MLKILVEGIDPIPEGMDPNIERVFDSVVLTGDPIERAIIKSVDQGEYLDATRFIDRLGVALYHTQLSTGCKAALCVYHFPTTPLCCIEVGGNAFEAIVTHCKEGTIYVPDRSYSFAYSTDVNIDVSYKGHHFTTLSEFEDYLS